ncbi:4'-phosphopantetheinyl transferase superfamily protein [Pinisolibacter sp.]|uniref:4'-phosphopantetheinyl transferase superfamily protein n=1 Tax=Pinisolibacter sp. TaxID=2172024 RepID=UPI002FDCDF5E
MTAEALAAALERLTPADLLVGCRSIGAGDEAQLLPEEARALPSTVATARRASGTARSLARDLLSRLGAPAEPILRSVSGAPLWLPGFVGSLAHDDEVAVAAVARAATAASVGIDVEPAEPLPSDVADLVVHGGDRLGEVGDPLAARLAFVAKEAVYKAVHPLSGLVLDWPDIRVDLAGRRAVASTGHIAELFLCRAPRLIVVARIPTSGG